MFLFSLIVVYFIPVFGREQSLIPIELDGPLDERIRYVPLGHNHIFSCEARSLVSHLVDTDASWTVIYKDGSHIKKEPVKSIKDTINDRFRQLDDGSLLAVGLQKWHSDVVLECRISTLNASSQAVVSRFRIGLLDCSTKLNPCFYGVCRVHGDPSTFQVVQCRCSPKYSGDFCEISADGYIWREVFFHSPVIFMFVGLITLFCFRHKIEWGGKRRPMSLEKHLLVKSNPAPSNLKELYPSAYISSDELEILMAKAEVSSREFKEQIKSSREDPNKNGKIVVKQ